MKKSLNLIIRGGVAAAVLACASSSAFAAPANLAANLYGEGVFTSVGGAFGPGDSLTPGVWNVTYDSNTFLAFCLQPTVALNGAANNYGPGSYVASDSVKRLYEGFYKNVSVSNATGAAAFQLALWELNNDNGDLLQGALRFDDLNQASVARANTMLGVALGNGAINNVYNYSSLNSVGPASQALLTVSPVPEPGTWAMMLAGLGMLGFMARRRKAGQI